MIKVEIKYPNGTILKRKFKKIEAAIKWLKVLTEGVKR